MNQDQKKQKLAQIKQKIKAVAPAAIAFTAAAASVALAINAAKNSSQKDAIAVEFEPFKEVSGEEKTKLLERDDIVIQEADPGAFWFISVVPQENNTES
jgi:predicted RNA methylase